VCEEKNKTLISLGISCQTTHQLRRLTNLQPDSGTVVPSGLFDWLICPVESTINLLNRGIPDYTKDSIQIRNGYPYWAELNIYFWHYFRVGDQHVHQIDIDATFEKELQRWRDKRERFAALDPEQTIFVISNTQNNLELEVFDKSERDQYYFTAQIVDNLRQCLAAYFRTTADNIHLEVVTRKNRSSGLNESDSINLFPLDHNQWKGSKQSWDKWWEKLHLTQTT